MNTVDALPQSTRAQAEARADFIRDRLKTVAEFWAEVIAAYRHRDWLALGYESWDAYLTGEFGPARVKLGRAERRELIASMRHAGMSTRAIGSAIGVDQSTVARDSADADASPVTGTDGKTYKPKPTREGWLRAAMNALEPVLTDAGATAP